MIKQLLTLYSNTLTTVLPPSPRPFITGQIKVELTNLALFPPSPYCLIIEQIEVELINLEDEVDTINSQQLLSPLRFTALS